MEPSYRTRSTTFNIHRNRQNLEQPTTSIELQTGAKAPGKGKEHGRAEQDMEFPKKITKKYDIGIDIYII